MNTQKPVKDIFNKGKLFIHSIFKTIQGEGPYVGQPSVFIRLYGCNLQCPMCDTDYTSTKMELSVSEILEDVSFTGKHKLVVITGGEPLLQDINPLVLTLHKMGYKIQVETNGTVYNTDLDYSKVTIVCSPKTPKVHPKLQPFVNCYKYVGGETNNMSSIDGLPLNVLGLVYKNEVFRPSEESVIYLQPVDSGDSVLNKIATKNVVNSCIDNNYKLGIQVHKIVEVN